MRPTLTLKKPAPAPVATVTPDAKPDVPVEPAKPAKAAKQYPKEAKEAQAAANRLLNEEQQARRRAQIEKVRPLVKSYLSDQAIFRDTVLVDGTECLRPLALGIHKTIFSRLRDQLGTLDCTSTVLTELIKAAMKAHVSRRKYIAGLLKFQERFDLDGNAVGPVVDKHKDRAQKTLQKFEKKAAQPA